MIELSRQDSRRGECRYEGGFAYMHVRRCKRSMPEPIDEALAAIGNVPGMNLDFRGSSSGGGFDHCAVPDRFLTKGAEALLREFPQASVRYDPAKYGWQPSK